MEEAQNLPTHPTVLYFFCKNGDGERDNFTSVARSLLSQRLAHNKDILLPYYHDRYASSAEAVLSSQNTIEDLLRVSIRNCPVVYIVLDGIDECPRKERETISSWFRKLVEGLPLSNPDQIRCLFVSQDDGVARKDFARLSTIKIRSEDNKADIEQFSSEWAARIQSKFGVSDEKCGSALPGTLWRQLEVGVPTPAILSALRLLTLERCRHVFACEANINESSSPS